MTAPLQWKACRLLPALDGVYTAIAYPAPNKAGNRYAYYAVLPTFPPIVALTVPSLDPHHTKLLTLQLAATALEDLPVGTKPPAVDPEALRRLEAYPGNIWRHLNAGSFKGDEEDA